MFLRANILKRLMKDAYKKSNFVMADNTKAIYISGGYWEVEIDREFVPKTILAEIMEIAGCLPEAGKRFEVTKDEVKEVEGRDSVYVPMVKRRINVTDIVIIAKDGVSQRVLQDEDSLDIMLINDVFIDIIDNKSIDYDNGETQAEGPFHDKLTGIYLWNNVMKFHALHRWDEKHQHITEYLSNIDLNEIPEE